MSEAIEQSGYSPSLPTLLLHALVQPRRTANALSQSPHLVTTGWKLVAIACVVTVFSDILEQQLAPNTYLEMVGDDLLGPVADMLVIPLFLVISFFAMRILWFWPFRYGEGFKDRKNFAAAALFIGLEVFFTPTIMLISILLAWMFVHNSPESFEAYYKIIWVILAIYMPLILFYQTSFFLGVWNGTVSKAFFVVFATMLISMTVFVALIAIPYFGLELIAETTGEQL